MKSTLKFMKINTKQNKTNKIKTNKIKINILILVINQSILMKINKY